MQNHDELVGNPKHTNDRYCLAQPGEVYVVYLPTADSSTQLDLPSADGDFDVRWYNPRAGGDLVAGSTSQVVGGGSVSLGNPPEDSQLDWVVSIRKNAG